MMGFRTDGHLHTKPPRFGVSPNEFYGPTRIGGRMAVFSRVLWWLWDFPLRFFPETLEAKKSLIQRQLADNIRECAKNFGIEARPVLCDDNTNCPQCGELAPVTVLPDGVCAVCWLGNLRN